jgi:polysaccharide deacetylase 2 family uncharacterized protein YibQ
MAKAKRSTRRAGGKGARKPTRRRGKATAWRWQDFVPWLRTTLTPRRIGLAAGVLGVLVIAGIVLGFVVARRIDAPPVEARATPGTAPANKGRDAKPGPQTAATAPPVYGRLEDLPEYPKYTDNAQGEQRPALEEPGRPGSGMARPKPAGQAWQRHAVPFSDDGRRPLVAIVIDDMGIDRPRSAKVVALPAPLTLSWLPYARELRDQSRAARQRGHELMLHLPMEPATSGNDPGPGALLTGVAREENARRLEAALGSFDAYVGVNNHMGSRFTTDRPAMESVLARLKERGLLFLDSRTSASSVGDQIANELGMPTAARHVFLDDVMTSENVRAQLAETERLARQQGFAVAIGHPHDATIAALADWLPTLGAKGLVAAPISAVVKRRGRWQ